MVRRFFLSLSSLFLSLRGSNQQLSRIIMVGMTAEPLRSLLGSLIGEIRKPVEFEKRVVDNVLKRIKEMISVRNDIIHSTWFIGWASPEDTDFSVARGHKRHRSNKGSSVKSRAMTVEQFAELTNEAAQLAELLLTLSGCYTFDHSIDRNFFVGDNGKIVSRVKYE